jgi:hypothetical protein
MFVLLFQSLPLDMLGGLKMKIEVPVCQMFLDLLAPGQFEAGP